jgi:hypothetical protein
MHAFDLSNTLLLGWTIDIKGDYATMKHTGFGERKMEVHVTKVEKAKKKLHPTHILGSAMSPGSKHGTGFGAEGCRCKNECHLALDFRGVMAMRESFFILKSEKEIMEKLMVLIRNANAEPQTSTRYNLGKHEVCQHYYASACGVSLGKMIKAIKGVRGNAKPAAILHGNTGKFYATKLKKMEICKSFWKFYYVKIFGARPNDDTELYPNKTQKLVWENYFCPWYDELYPNAPRSDRPSNSCLYKNMKGILMENVRKSKQHFHLKCGTCSGLENEMNSCKGMWESLTEMHQYLRRLKIHTDSIRAWSAIWMGLTNASSHSPAEINTVLMDDTTARGFPHLGTRLPKDSAGKHRVRFTPMLIWTPALPSTMKHYVYSLTGKHAKGANRWCTLLHHIIRLHKNSGTAAAHARRLVIITDNYSENKNNEDFAYCSHAVMEGWYDSIEIIMGEPGHGHTWIDADHNNESKCLSLMAGTCS